MAVVLGGGISGLAACHYLLKSATQKVTLLEASQRLGGWIQTTVTPDGFVFEHGPRTVRPKGEQGANTLALVDELGLSDKVRPIGFDHPAALNRLIYVDNQLHALPSSLLSLFKSMAPFSKPLVSALLHDLRAPRKECKDESIYSFVHRRLGPELAEYAISPMICGICAGNAKEISVKFLMKSLFDAEQKHGSITRGMIYNMMKNRGGNEAVELSPLAKRSRKEKWSVWSLKGGLEQFPKALEENIVKGGVQVSLNDPCAEITFVDSHKAVVKTAHSEYEANHVYSTIAAPKLGSLLKKQHPDLAKELTAIPYVTVAVINLQYKGKVINDNAFGFLIPPSQNVPILGVIYDTGCFPHGDNTILTVMMGGHWFEKLFGKNPPEGNLLDTAVREVAKILGIKSQPATYNVTISRDCIPQYVVGHHDRVDRIRGYVSKHGLPLSLAGSSFDGVGVNDVILSAKKAVFSG